MEININQLNSTGSDSIYQQVMNSSGISTISNFYISTTDNQDKNYEKQRIANFISMYAHHYAQHHNVNIDAIKVDLINYGLNELVYMMQVGDEALTLLVKQPCIQKGLVKEEADNLTKLHELDENVIAPIEYFENEDCELYATPYINKARCVSVVENWGVYVPEPRNHFEMFFPEDTVAVCTSIIAKLVNLYDFDDNKGLASCYITSGDFMLAEDWEDEEITIDRILPRLYLIAARSRVSCSFEEYIEMIRREFSSEYIASSDNDFIIKL